MLYNRLLQDHSKIDMR